MNPVDLDTAIVNAFVDLAVPLSVLALQTAPSRALCNVVNRQLGATIPPVVTVQRLFDLDAEGRLPKLLIT